MTLEFPDMPDRMKQLKRDHRGYPVPWFVKWYGDKPDFRMIGNDKFRRAIRQRLCWVCGQALGRYMAFVIGPMCAVNRTTSEPPCHYECAVFAARWCPFLANPRMHRQEHKLPDERWVPGIQIARNPGVACVWITRDFELFDVGGEHAGTLIEIGDPTQVLWFYEGAPATDAEIWHSIETGLPALLELVRQDKDPEGAMAELRRRTKEVARLVPPPIDVDQVLERAMVQT